MMTNNSGAARASTPPPRSWVGDAVSPEVAIVAGASGALGHATTITLAVSGLTVVAVDRTERGCGELPDGVRREVADTTDPEW